MLVHTITKMNARLESVKISRVRDDMQILLLLMMVLWNIFVFDFIMKPKAISDFAAAAVSISSYMEILKSFRLKHLKKLIIWHLNINSMRQKYAEISELCLGNIADILFLSETKLDASFPIAQFNISGYKCHRADRNSNGGGIMVYIRSDIAYRRWNGIEIIVAKPVESLTIKVMTLTKNVYLHAFTAHIINISQHVVDQLMILSSKWNVKKYLHHLLLGI